MLTHVNLINDHYPFKYANVPAALGIVSDISIILTKVYSDLYITNIKISDNIFTCQLYGDDQLLCTAEYSTDSLIVLQQSSDNFVAGFLKLRTIPAQNFYYHQKIYLCRDVYTLKRTGSYSSSSGTLNIQFNQGFQITFPQDNSDSSSSCSEAQYDMIICNNLKFSSVISLEQKAAQIQKFHLDKINNKYPKHLIIASDRSDAYVKTINSSDQVKVLIGTTQAFKGCKD